KAWTSGNAALWKCPRCSASSRRRSPPRSTFRFLPSSATCASRAPGCANGSPSDRRRSSVDAKDFQRIEALFNAALERPAAEREASGHASGEEPAVREAALRLLARAFSGDTTLHSAALSAAAAAATPAMRRVGSYEVLRELGAGGMGTVLLAERAFGE